MSVAASRSFSSGEIDPRLYARCDLQKYLTALKTARNFIGYRHGGMFNRPGTQFVGEVYDSTQSTRLIEWVYNTTTANTYTLVLGNLTMQFIQNGGFVTEAAKNITAITNANPGVFTSAAHGFANGNRVFVTGVGGTTQVNRDTFFIVQNVTANTFTLTTTDGAAIDTTSYGVYTSGGTVSRIYTIATPWAAADIFNIRFAQNQSAMYFAHPSYPPQQLVFTSSTSWALSQVPYWNSTAYAPRAVGITGSAGSNTYVYRVTAVYTNGKESLPGTESQFTVTGISQANPGVLTISAPSTWATGDVIAVDSVGGMTQVNKRQFTVTKLSTTTFQLGVDTTSYTAFSASGSDAAARVGYTATGAAAPTFAAPITVTWTGAAILSTTGPAPITVSGYNIYVQGNGGQFGLIGSVSSQTLSFKDFGITPNTTFTPFNYVEVFRDTGTYPSAVTFYQQRLVFANSTTNPTTVWASNVGDYQNFAVHSPQIASDAVIFTIPSQRVNPIQHLRDMGQLVVFTTDGEGSCAGDTSGALTPTGINFRQYSYNGSNNLRPIVLDTSCVYAQYQGAQIRDLTFDLIVNGYHGNEINVYCAHLFEGYTIVDWAFARIPNPILWMVRSDGKLLGITYVKDQQLVCAHEHDFPGATVESVTVIPEGKEDAVYLLIKRTIGGLTKRYVERLATRVVADVRDFNYLDSSGSFDGRNTGSTTMTLSGGTTWVYTEDLTLTASASTFGSWSTGDQCQMTGSDGSLIRCTVKNIGSNTVATVRSNKTVPASLRSTAVTTWARAVQSVTGLWHLASQSVSVLADGYVQANPNNPVYKAASVSATGVLTLPGVPAAVVKIGLPYTSDLETLNVDYAQMQSVGNQAIRQQDLTVWVHQTRGFWAGTEAPANDLVGTTYTGTVPPLIETKIRTTEGYDSPVTLVTDKVEVTPIGEINSNGRLFLRNSDPLPCGITGIIAAGMVPMKGGVGG